LGHLGGKAIEPFQNAIGNPSSIPDEGRATNVATKAIQQSHPQALS
jgi:hypothetical protein